MSFVGSFMNHSFSGWPERFLDTYKNLPANYHDESMNHHDIDEKFACLDAGSNGDLLSIQRLCQRMELTSYSTSFSGIDSPGSAFAQLRYAASFITGTDVEHPQHLYGIATSLYIHDFVVAQWFLDMVHTLVC